eukprot:scaffold12125_cov63-Phaeocystis_antarctica.AAC.4
MRVLSVVSLHVRHGRARIKRPSAADRAASRGVISSVTRSRLAAGLCVITGKRTCIGGRVGGWATGADWCAEPQARGAHGFRGKRRVECGRAGF